MEYINIKNTDLKVSRFCMGGCAMGGHGWGIVNDNDLSDAVKCALDKGVTIFDTADTYGLGKSEETLGKSLGDNRKKVSIATKFGVRVENGGTFYDNSPQWIEKALHNSLKRLNTDYIDIYQIHYRDGKTPLSAVVETLEKFKAQGKIRYFGLSNIFKDDLNEFETFKSHFVSFQDEYSLACRKNEKDIFNLSEKLEMTPFTWGSLGQGILTGKYDKDSVFGSNDRRSREIYVNFHGDKLLHNLKIVEVLKDIALEINKPVSAVAIRFILDYVPDSVVIAGIKNPGQVIGNCEALDWNLTSQQIKRLEEISKYEQQA